jgi:hypothetical protein
MAIKMQIHHQPGAPFDEGLGQGPVQTHAALKKGPSGSSCDAAKAGSALSNAPSAIDDGTSQPDARHQIVQLLRLGLGLLALGMAAYYLLKPVIGFEDIVESGYVSTCTALMSRDPVAGQYRIGFRKLEAGEIYPVGRPQQTTGYYTKFTMSFGQAQKTLICYADLRKQFTHAETYMGGAGCTRHDPDGRSGFC